MQGAPEADTGSVHGTYAEDGSRGATPQMDFLASRPRMQGKVLDIDNPFYYNIFVALSAVVSLPRRMTAEEDTEVVSALLEGGKA
jgi:hypothetical protein